MDPKCATRTCTYLSFQYTKASTFDVFLCLSSYMRSSLFGSSLIRRTGEPWIEMNMTGTWACGRGLTDGRPRTKGITSSKTLTLDVRGVYYTCSSSWGSMTLPPKGCWCFCRPTDLLCLAQFCQQCSYSDRVVLQWHLELVVCLSSGRLSLQEVRSSIRECILAKNPLIKLPMSVVPKPDLF